MAELQSPPLEGEKPLAELDTRELIRVMVKIQRLRREAIEDYKQFAKDAARKKADAVKLKTRRQLESDERTAEDRKARGVLDSAEAFYEAEIAESLVEACEKAMWVLKDDWDTCRSANSNERAEKSATDGFGS